MDEFGCLQHSSLEPHSFFAWGQCCVRVSLYGGRMIKHILRGPVPLTFGSAAKCIMVHILCNCVQSFCCV